MSPAMNSGEIAALRMQLLHGGFWPLPLCGKSPYHKDWTNVRACTADIRQWGNDRPDASNTGILTQRNPALDLDILDERAADAIENLVRGRVEERGYVLVRTGRWPKRAFLMRTDEPFSKITVKLIPPGGGKEERVELLADGQQLVVAGIHPETGQAYRWRGGDPATIARESLPYTREADARELIEEIVELLVNEFGYQRAAERPEQQGNGHDNASGPVDVAWSFAEETRLRSALATIPADERLLTAKLGDSHEAFFKIGMAIERLGWGERGFAILRDWCSQSQEFDEKGLRTQWASFQRNRNSRANPVTVGTVFHYAQQFRNAAQPASGEFPPEDRDPRAGSGQDTQPLKQQLLVSVRRIFPIDGSSIPQRNWIVPGLLMRGHLTVLVAPTGSGKSLMTIQVGLACAVNMVWAGWRPRGNFRTMFINSEDDVDEMKRRHFAAATTMGLDQNELRDRLIIADERDGIVIARYNRQQQRMVKEPLLERLVATILAEKIDILFVDPFAETFDGDENSNNELKWAGVLWREVARRTNIAVCLVHHTKKYASGMAGDVDASRGAGALVNISRIMSTIFTMTKDEAGAMGVDEIDRGRYIRYDDAKANLNLITRQARWFYKDTFVLPNSTADLAADEVGVLVPWKPTGIPDGVTQEVIDQLFAEIDRGMLASDGRPIGEFYTASNKQNKDVLNRWVGRLVQEALTCPEPRTKKVISEWVSDGKLVEFQYRSPTRRRLLNGLGTPAKKAEIESAKAATENVVLPFPPRPDAT
jgi:hypothetical protein